MSNDRKGQFAVHCILCGKNFYADTEIKCGCTFNGKPLCKTGDIQREMERRFVDKKGGAA